MWPLAGPTTRPRSLRRRRNPEGDHLRLAASVIGIVNVGPVEGETNPIGEHCYEIRINRQVVATYTHHRANGLAECLRQAACAVERKRDLDAFQLLQEIQEKHGQQSRNIRRTRRQA